MTLPTIFEAVHKLPVAERQSWYTTHETPSNIQMEVEELLRYDGLAEDEDFLAAKVTEAERDGLVGKYIGPYHITRLIGHGGMGSVYHAERQEPYRQEVALKVADVRLRTGAARFQVERQLLAELQHPGIARILDGGMLPDERPYLVMEYVAGQHIDTYADQHKLRVMERVALCLQVCDAVAAAHERGVVHRDLKPSNILVTEAGRVVVVDFGLARRWEETAGLTQTAMVLGTPEYMAPEQASGRKATITPAADVYALGAVLYTLLTGRPPFRADTPFHVITMSLQEEPVSPRRLNQAVPRDLETLCLHCLKKKPEERYASAKELVAETQRFQRGEPLRAKPVGWLAAGWRWAKHRPALAALSVGLLVTIVTSLIAIGYYWRKSYYSLETAKAATVQLFEHAIKLTNEPGMQKAQVELLSKAVRSYDSMIRVLNDEQITVQYLKARRELFHRNIALGNRDNEEQLVEELLRDTEAFVKVFPSSSDVELEWAHALRRMGFIAARRFDAVSRREHLQTTLEHHQHSEAILRRLSARHPERDSLRGLHADMLTSVAAAERALGLQTRSETHLDEARKIFKHLYGKYPGDPQARIRYCQILFTIADSIEHQPDKGKKYGELLEEVYQLDCAFLKEFPDRHDHRVITSDGVFRLARWLERQGKWERARELYLDLITLSEKLVENYPDVIDYASSLCERLYYHGTVCYAMGRIQEAEQSFTRSFNLRRKIISKSNVRSAYELSLASNLLHCPLPAFRNVDQAEAVLLKLSDAVPVTNGVYQLNLGMVRLRQNRLPESREAFIKAHQQRHWSETETEYLLPLALVHAKLGDAAKAREHLAATTQYFQRFPKDIVLSAIKAEVDEELRKLTPTQTNN